ANAHADRESAHHSSGPPGSATRKLLGDMDEISYQSAAWLRVIFSGSFFFLKIMESVREAFREIREFYKIYHSMRWVKGRLVIRLNQALSKRAIADLNEKFADVLREGEIIQGAALREEKTEPEIWNLPRLILTPYRDRFGRLRQMIDAINSSTSV